MIFNETKLAGSFVIEIELLQDERGFFARAWCEKEFQDRGLKTSFVQCNISRGKKSGTIRGLHYQAPPCEEAKLIRCTKGAIHDVIIDLRSDSPTRFQWVGVELTADNHKMLYVPEGFAQGFQTLEDDIEVSYPVTQFYTPKYERGIRWDDPTFAIEWPEAETRLVSEKDMAWPDYADSQLTQRA